MLQRNAVVHYKSYNPSQFSGEIEVLEDVDRYFQDLVYSLGTIDEPKIFITAWVLISFVCLKTNFDIEDLFVRELSKPKSCLYILLNTFIGRPAPELVWTSHKMRLRVCKRVCKKYCKKKACKKVCEKLKGHLDRFKIILSTNMRFQLPDLPWQIDAAFNLPINYDFPEQTGLAVALQGLWIDQWPGNKEDKVDLQWYRNLSVFTLGSHHQKTVTVHGKSKANQQPLLLAYVGGIDLGTGPAGYKNLNYWGGKWWLDTMIRVKNEHAIGVLENFVTRWNDDLSQVSKDRTLAYGVAATDTLDAAIIAPTFNGTSSTKIQVARTIPLGGSDWPTGQTRVIESKEAYETWISQASDRIVLFNQYFRHGRIVEMLAERLNVMPDLQITIVIPSYTEEIARASEFAKLRDKFAKSEVEERPPMIEDARLSGLRIDPINKLTLYLRSRSLRDLIKSNRVRVWIPNPIKKKWPGTPYVHSKFALFDDKALMVGSANLCSRSLDGRTDSEINLILLDRDVIQRIKNIYCWHIEPESENDDKYARTWYAHHNLMRYTEEHRKIDEIYGQFPSGRAGIMEYFETYRSNGIGDTKIGKRLSPALFEAAITAATAAGLLIDGDIGDQMAGVFGYLV